MKKITCLLMAVILLNGIWAYGAAAEDKSAPAENPKMDEQAATKTDEQAVTGSVGVSVLNKYVFRGYELSNKSVVVQPTSTVSYAGFGVTFWGNYDSHESATQSFVPDNPGHSSFNEADLTLCYSRSFGIFTVMPGYSYYATRYANETQEVFLSGALDILTKPVLSVYRDIDNYPGTYVNLAMSHAFALPVVKGATFDIGASAGYFVGDSNYWKTYQSSTGAWTGGKYADFHDGMLKAGVTIPVGKHFTFQPMVQYWFPLSGNASRTVDGNNYNPNGHLDQTVVYGLNAAFNF
jgi:hypothetical protein